MVMMTYNVKRKAPNRTAFPLTIPNAFPVNFCPKNGAFWLVLTRSASVQVQLTSGVEEGEVGTGDFNNVGQGHAQDGARAVGETFDQAA